VCRASIGTINHTLLSLREIERSQLRLAAIVMNVTHPADADSTSETCSEIERISGQKVSAVVPYLSQAKDGPAPTRAAMNARALASLEDQLDVKRLLGLEGRRKKVGTKRYEKK